MDLIDRGKVVPISENVRLTAPLEKVASSLLTVEPVPDQPAASSPSVANGPTQKEIARNLYFAIRQKDPEKTHVETIDFMVDIFSKHRAKLPPNAPPPDRALLLRMAADNDWDYQIEGERLRLNPRATHASAASRLQHLLEMQEDAFLILRDAQKALTPVVIKGEGDDDDIALGSAQMQAQAEKRYTAALESYERISKLVKEEEAELRRDVLERTDTTRFEEEVERHYQAIYKEYDGLGAVYEILCRQLAGIVVMREALIRSGRQDAGALDSLTKQQVAVIAQIQKHTEATKSESVSAETKEIARKMLSVIETIVAPENPEMWQRVVKAIISAWPKSATPTTKAGAA